MGCYSSKAAVPPQPLPGLAQTLPSSQTPHFKVVLLGDSGVGKSSLLLRQARGQFSEECNATVGAAFSPLSLRLDDGTVVKFEVWDTAGQERYASLAPLYYRGAAAAVLVYDLSRPASLERAKHWASELRRNAGNAKLVVLVGNKSDLVDAGGAVGQKEAEEYACSLPSLAICTSRAGLRRPLLRPHLSPSQGMPPIFLASAKTGQGVHELFVSLAKQLVAAGQPAAAPGASAAGGGGA
eukprot:scaffold19.g1846.t1